MQKKEIMKNLKKAIFKIMSEMFFIFNSDEEPYNKSARKDCHIYTININNESQILLEFKLNRELMNNMMSNFTGTDYESLKDEEVIEGIKEFVNIVSGNFIEIFEEKMNMGIPAIQQLDYDTQKEGYNLVDEDELWFEDQIMYVKIFEK